VGIDPVSWKNHDFKQEGREDREGWIKTLEPFPIFPAFPTFLFK